MEDPNVLNEAHRQVNPETNDHPRKNNLHLGRT